MLFGPLPPPTNGHTLAFRLLVEACRERQIPCRVVNYSETAQVPVFAQRWLQRLYDYIAILTRYVKALREAPDGTVYITLNQAVSGVYRDILLIFLARVTCHRVVVHLHGGCYDQVLTQLPAIVRKAAVKALSACDSIVLLSCRLIRMFHAFPQLASRLRVVPNGLPMIPPSVPAPKTIDQRSPVRLLFLSHFIESKGWVEILEAVDLLVKEQGLLIEATFCGSFIQSPDDRRFDSSDKAQRAFDSYASSLSPNARIVRHEMVQGEVKEKLLREAHFLLLPSRYPNEGQPLVLIEGLAFGCVLVGTDYRALGDMIKPGQTGCFVESTPRSIAAAIAHLVDNPNEYQRLSKGAIQLYRDEFTPEKHLERLFQVLQAKPVDQPSPTTGA